MRRIFSRQFHGTHSLIGGDHRLLKAVGLAVGVGLVAALTTALVGYNPPDADIKYDWLSARGAVSSNAYRDIMSLGVEEGVHLEVHFPLGEEPPFAHPRTPGAILMAIPLLLLDFDDLMAVSVGVTVAIGVLMVALFTDLSNRWRMFGVLALFFASAPFLTTVRFAGQSMVVAGSALLGWLLYERRHDLPAGLLIAFAGTLKLFPLVLLVPMMLQRRFRPVAVAVVGFIALNSAGLLLPGVALADSINALVRGREIWFRLLPNGSLSAGLARLGVDQQVGQLIAMVLALALLIWASRSQRERLVHDPILWFILALLVLPISWISYDIVLVPALAYGLTSSRRADRLITFGVWVFWIGMGVALIYGVIRPEETVDMGWTTVAVRLLAVAGWSVAAIGWDWRRCWLANAGTDRLPGLRSAASQDGSAAV